MSRPRSLVLVSLLALWAAVTAALTLSPSTYTPPLTLETFACVGCTSFGTADIIVNWLWFLPGGAVMSMLLGWRRAVFVALCMTATIETVQIGIPGRSPALQDLIFNTLGAACGVLMVRRGLGRRFQYWLAALSVLAWLSPVVLLIPMTTRFDLYGQWTPAFAQMETYEGSVLSAAIGGLPVRSGALPDKAALDAAIVGRSPIELSLRVGPPPASLAPVFQVVDVRQHTVMSVGALGEDLIVSGNNPAQMLRLAQPYVRWPGAMEEATPGDTVVISIDRTESSVCVSVADRTRCDLAPTLGDGWGHLVHLERAPGWLLVLAGMLWALSIGLVLGVTSPSARVASIRGVVLAAAGLAASYLSPDIRPSAVHAIILAASGMIGASLQSPIRRLWSLARTSPATPPTQ